MASQCPTTQQPCSPSSPTMTMTLTTPSHSRTEQHDLYASSVSSSSDTSPSPTSSPSSYHHNIVQPEGDIPRPDSPRPMPHDQSALARARLSQLVVWGDAAEEARDSSPASVDAYHLSSRNAVSFSASGPPHDNPLEQLALDVSMEKLNPQSLTTSSSRQSQSQSQSQSQQAATALKPPVPSAAFRSKLQSLDSPVPAASACTLAFPGTPSSPASSSSSDDAETDDDWQANTRNQGRLCKLERELNERQRGEDRTQPSPWHDGSDVGLMRRKSFFNVRRPSVINNNTNNNNIANNNYSAPYVKSTTRKSSTRNCYSTGYPSSHMQTTRQSCYGGGGFAHARRPQSFHRYARIGPDWSGCREEGGGGRNAHTNNMMDDDFDDLMHGLHATKVTESSIEVEHVPYRVK